MSQFLRKVKVRFIGEGGSLEVNATDNDVQLYVSFDVERTISSKTNTATINIHNLSKSSRASIGEEFTDVELEAGYDGATGIIFSGQIRDFENSREDTDIITSITCGDGDKATRKSTVLKTFSPGTTKEEVVDYIFAQFEAQGIERGEWLFPEMEAFLRPYSISGSAIRELDLLGRSNGFYWSIQNNVLEILPSAEYLPQVTLLNSRTGMLGLPKTTDNGIKVDALINPEVRPNRLIKVESDYVDINAENGEYRVGSINYHGDNAKGSFVMEIHGESKVGEEINEGKK